MISNACATANTPNPKSSRNNDPGRAPFPEPFAAYEKLGRLRQYERPAPLWKGDDSFEKRVNAGAKALGRPLSASVRVLPNQDPGPFGRIYRLSIELAEPPPGVWWVSYDLHPPLEGSHEPRVERFASRPPVWPRQVCVPRAAFRALLHTPNDYFIRVRLSDGTEDRLRVVCALHNGWDGNDQTPGIAHALAKASPGLEPCSKQACFCRELAR